MIELDLCEMTGADLLIETLAQQGIGDVFGCQSDGMLPFYQKLTNFPYFNYIQLKHEQAAVHAADGYARSTGKPGVVLLSSAAGVVSGVTGIATAYSDSVPLVVITGQYDFNKTSDGASASADYNFSGINVPITKHIYHVTSGDNLQEVVQLAFHVATEGRPGPVVVELSGEVLTSLVCPSVLEFPEPKKRSIPLNQNAFAKAVELIEAAEMPVIFIGGGTNISGGSEVLREIVARTGIPVVSSMMGLGVMNGSDQSHLGMLGMHGTFASNKAVHRCDLLVAVGVRFSDRVTGKISGFSPKSKKIHVDIDPAEINKIIPVDLPIVSDAKDFLDFVKENLDFDHVRSRIKNWARETSEMKRVVPRFDQSKSILNPKNVIKLLDEYSGEDAIVVTDVGQHQIWAANHYKFTKPRSLVTSGGLGTMGFGLPAAIGAMIGNPTRNVICVSGDGSFQMNLQELITAVAYRLPIKIAIMNNGYLGMVRQWQEMFYDRRYSSVKITSPDFVTLAEAYGAVGLQARDEVEAREIITKAFQIDGPVLMEFNVIEEENVYPIVPPNQSNANLILGACHHPNFVESK
ncbi:biosynthetic-type acetolactate synthase large subunit [Bacillus marasmi]|uniref:biosynthetic-type acetolactate synthase large subunit n=1 Tax=Bacillus marasmi TaxID=1926279 RepID=UPI001FEC9198|nr:biosynthetic-type acetolactate synthase large subunit [Bacillus marasmi]